MLRESTGFYNIIIGLHILAVIAWMSGLLYLPRLYVYHTRAAPGGEADELFKVMELKLMRIIINPSMFAVFGLGGLLVWIDLVRIGPGFWTHPWALTKLAAVLFLGAWHGFLSSARRAFAEGRNVRSERFWRMTNELPFLAAIIVVLSVTTKFGS